MQWATAPAAASDIPATTEAGSAVLQATLPAGKTARVPTPSDIELLRVRQRLLQWTTQRLAQAHPDASLILLHHALLEEAVRSQVRVCSDTCRDGTTTVLWSTSSYNQRISSHDMPTLDTWMWQLAISKAAQSMTLLEWQAHRERLAGGYQG
jgi:hypothetical protein